MLDVVFTLSLCFKVSLTMLLNCYNSIVKVVFGTTFGILKYCDVSSCKMLGECSE